MLGKCVFVLASFVLFSSPGLAQSNKKIDHKKSVMTDEVYYLIPLDEKKDKPKDVSSSNTKAVGGKDDSQVSSIGSGVSAIESSSVMAPPPGGGGGSSGPDPLHESYARQNIREDLSPYGVDLLGEQFDLGTGTLSFNHTDVVLPGNNGLEVAIRRTVNTAQGIANPDNEFGDWA